MKEPVLLWITNRNDREDRDLRPFLEAAEEVVPVHFVQESELNDALEREASDRVIGAIVSPSVSTPATIARRFFQCFPGSEVIFISGQSEGGGQKREMNIGFLYGHHRTIAASDPDEGGRTIRRLLQQAHRHRRSRWALARMNEQMAQANDSFRQKRVAISDQLLLSILAQTPDALLALDLDGYILAANRAAVAAFDLEHPEGVHLEKTRLAEELPELQGLVQKAIRRKETSRREMILKARNASGADDVILEVSASPVFHQQDRLVGITVLLRDVTRLKAVEERLREMNEALEVRVADRTRELEEANARMERFLYSAAHDLRTPIRAIREYTRFLSEDQKAHLSDQSGRFIQRILDASHRMDLLILDLLAYSRVSNTELSLEPVELVAVLEAARLAVAEQATACGGEIEIAVSPGLVRAHRTTLEQVVVNLLSNALHYGKADLPVRITIANEWREGRCRIWITDNGIGIDPRYHRKIFNMFERVAVASNPPGTGIGLAIVKGGMERMGGSVGVESELGKGSSFWIELPVPGGNPGLR